MKTQILTLVGTFAVLVLVAIATASGANAAQDQNADATHTLTFGTRTFDTLSAAVASGKLDRAVLETLQADGSVDALVTVRYTNPSASSLKTRAAKLEQTFETQEAAALDAADASDVDVIRPYTNLPTTFVRFASAEALLEVVNAPEVAFVRANTPLPAADAESLPLIHQPEATPAGNIGAGTYVAV